MFLSVINYIVNNHFRCQSVWYLPDRGNIAWLCDSGGRDGDDRLSGLEGNGSRQRRLLVVEVAHLTAEVVLLALAVPELADAEVVELDPVQGLYVRIAPRSARHTTLAATA